MAKERAIITYIHYVYIAFPFSISHRAQSRNSARQTMGDVTRPLLSLHTAAIVRCQCHIPSLASSLDGWMASSLDGWMAGLLDGWMDGWLAGGRMQIHQYTKILMLQTVSNIKVIEHFL